MSILKHLPIIFLVVVIAAPVPAGAQIKIHKTLNVEDGLAEFDGRVRRVFSTGDNLAHNRVWSLCAARDGTLYIGTRAGATLSSTVA